jgi:uncharacterized repeat protein (TIGR03803 family)
MSPSQILDVLVKANRNGSRGRVLACALLLAFAAAPLHAQFNYIDLYDFENCGDGCLPQDYGQLWQGKDGNLYGTTETGGKHDLGTIFRVTPAGVHKKLVDFDGTNGSGPAASLTLATDGNFYGTTIAGGASNQGTIFKLAIGKKTVTFTTLHSFNGTDGAGVAAPPVEAYDGTTNALYGVTMSGTTYRVTLPAGTFQQLSGNAPGESEGPLLALGEDLYGTTVNGGNSSCTGGCGTVFHMTTTGAINTIYSFSGTDGAEPRGPLALGVDGNLYGITEKGGVNGNGEVYNLSLTGVWTPLHNFSALAGGFNSDGANPVAGLLAATDGMHFYGSTAFGGTTGDGTIFEITSGGTFGPVYELTGTGGMEPGATLMYHTNGLFYGTTVAGGANGVGVFYSVTPEQLIPNIAFCCWWVELDELVIVMGNGLTGAVSVSFGSVQAQFKQGSDTYLTATVPSAAIDAPVTVTLATGLQVESQQTVHILPKIINLDPSSGAVGTQVGIVGGGFEGTTKVTFGGVPTGNFVVVSPSLIQATVPSGAKTGKVGVVTPNGATMSKETFTVN